MHWLGVLPIGKAFAVRFLFDPDSDTDTDTDFA